MGLRVRSIRLYRAYLRLARASPLVGGKDRDNSFLAAGVDGPPLNAGGGDARGSAPAAPIDAAENNNVDAAAEAQCVSAAVQQTIRDAFICTAVLDRKVRERLIEKGEASLLYWEIVLKDFSPDAVSFLLRGNHGMGVPFAWKEEEKKWS